MRLAALSFLSDIWLQYPAKIEDKEYKANNIISLLTKATREKSITAVFGALTLLFKLLL